VCSSDSAAFLAERRRVSSGLLLNILLNKEHFPSFYLKYTLHMKGVQFEIAIFWKD
jgi:hypothetical protein